MSRKKDRVVEQDVFPDIFILKNWIKNDYIDTMLKRAGGELLIHFKNGMLRLKRLDSGELSGVLKSRSPRTLRIVTSMLADTGIVLS